MAPRAVTHLVPFMVLDSNSRSTSNSEVANNVFYTNEPNSFLNSLQQRDITDQARITASSSKSGHPAENLRVHRLEDVNKLWQSDGLIPHHIRIDFEQQQLLSELRFFIDFKSDESYTPRTVVLQAGSSFDSLLDFTTVQCEGSQGWICVDLTGGGGGNNEVDFLRAATVRIAITGNCQMGRDSRIRGIRIFAPNLHPSTLQSREDRLSRFLK